MEGGRIDLDVKAANFSWKLFRYGTSFDYALIVGATILNLTSGVLLPIFMALFGDMFDALAGVGGGRTINFYVLWQVGLGGISFVLCFFGAAWMELAAERQLKAMKIHFLSSIMRQEMGWFDQYDSGKLASTLNENSVVIRDALGIKFGQLFLFVGIFVGGYVTGIVKGWKLALVLTSTLPLLAFGGFMMMKVLASAGDKTRGEYAQAGSLAEETLSTIRSIVAFGLEQQTIQRYNMFLERAQRIGAIGAIKMGAAMGSTFGSLFLTYALGFWYGGRLIAREDFTGGKVLGVFFCIIMGAFSVGQAGPSISALGRAAGAVETMHALITRPSKIDPTDPSGHTQTQPLDGHIAFKNVKFAYPTRPDRLVFSNLNLTIEAGKSVALVGASGCGKSTIIQLIERFYDPDDGEVLIDGRNIKEYNLRWLRQEMALVSQEPRLFATSITDNISAGKEGSDSDAVQQAAKSANAHDFIMGFPDGYDTYVGEAGNQLSGGQKQRVAIARAILRDPSILILDEATSALDNESERIVQETLDKVVQEKARTTIIIAHRLTTVRNADKIVVLDNHGSGAFVAEEGTHQELMEIPNGLYAALVASQTLPGATDDEPVDDLSDIADSFKDDIPAKTVSMLRLRSKFSISKESRQSSFLGSYVHLESSEKITEKSRYGQVFKLLKPYWLILLVGLIGAAINGLSFPTFAIVFSKFMTTFYLPVEEVETEGRKWALVFVGFAAGAFLGNFLQQAAFGWSGQKVVQKLRATTFKELIYQDIGFFDHPDHSTGKLSEVLSADPVSCRGWVGDNLGIYLQNASAIIAAIVISFFASPKLAAVCLAGFASMVPAMMLESKLIGGHTEGIGGPSDDAVRTKAIAEGNVKQLTETTGYILNEVIVNLRTVAAYTMENKMDFKYQRVVNQSYNQGRRKAWLLGLAWGFSQMMQFLVQALTLWYGTRLASTEGLSIEKMMQAIFSLMMAAMGMGQTMIFMTDNVKAKAAANRLFSIIERKPLIDARSVEGVTFKGVSQCINFKHLRFRYPARPDVLVYRDLSFDIKEGEVVALVGGSGCGKSTVVQLLERFYEAKGFITIDGVPLQDLNVKSLRSQIGLVNQEPVLFDTTIEENIALGSPSQDCTPQAVEEAARMANAYSFIKDLSDGFQTNVGKLGGQLSGGQKQRIAIARALIRNPSILILDEATSALDAESERVVQEALDRLLETQKRTTIVIAHRLSTIKNADKIIVMVNRNKEGTRVAEVGTHDQLMEIPHGVYRGLVKIAHGR